MMWRKIDSIEELQKLSANTLLMKYPISGDPESIFGDDDNNFDIRKIIKNNKEFQEIELDIIESNVSHNSINGIGIISFSSIKLNYQSIIDENKYWVKK